LDFKGLNVKKIALYLGIDRAVFYTLLGRGWNIGAGLLTIFLVAHFLSPETQGFYYTFNSLIALQVFAELGLSFAIIQFSSHEMAHLSWMDNGTVQGSPDAKRRLQSLMNFSITWFGVAALLMILILIPVGLYFFDAIDLDAIDLDAIDLDLVMINKIFVPNIAIPWLILVVFTALNLFVTATSSILEGCGKVSHIAIIRLWKSVFSTTSLCIVLYFNGSLYSLAVSSVVSFLISFLWLYVRYKPFFIDLHRHSKNLPGMKWKTEIWPFQWRIAISWMCGFFIFQIFNPLLFKTQGPAAAGQMGMTMQIIGAMNGFAMVWISTKAPAYGQLIAKKRFNELDSLFKRGFLQSFGFLLIVVSAVWMGLFYLNYISSPYSHRVLPLHLFSYLCLVCFINHIVFAEAAYLRAFKREPFMINSVVGGLMTTSLAFWLIPSMGLVGAIYAYLIPSLLIGLVGGAILFVRKRKEWVSGLNDTYTIGK
jgi:O-antigen/teichoic acid export membrane protein